MSLLLWSVAFGAAALASALLVVGGPAGDGWSVLPFAVGLAALGLAPLLRKWIGSRRPRLTRKRAAVIGALIALLSHPLAWCLFVLYHAASSQLEPLAHPPSGPVDVLWFTLVFSFWSLLLTGWWTIPLGAAVGVVLSRFDGVAPPHPAATRTR